DVLDGVGLLTERDRERREADGAAAELLDDRAEELAVEALEPRLVDLEQLERLLRDLARDGTGVPHLRHVAHAAQDPVRDSGRSTGAARDLLRGRVLDLDAEDASAPPDDRSELSVRVQIEPERQPEAVAQRRREEAGARRRTDERERRQVERQRPRRRPLADDDVEPEVLERRVEDLLDRPVQPVDLVDEEDVARLERGEDRRHVALSLERGASDLPDADAELAPDDLRERRLPEPGRTGEKHVVERFAARLRRVERDSELLLDAPLADEVAERRRSKGALELFLAGVVRDRRDELRHAALFSALRTCSSTGSDSSTPASARSASGTDHPSSTRASRASTPAPAVPTSGALTVIFSRSSSTTRCAVLRP